VESWAELARPAPDTVTVAGADVRAGSCVILRPRSTEDVVLRQLDGRRAIVDSIEQDLEDNVLVAVTLEGDPARDLGKGRQLGHRFFLTPDELEPLSESGAARPRRILVAGIGNVFMGDDGFGVEVAARLSKRPLPDGVDVVDFGIRSVDLAYTLGDGYYAALLIDASPRGQPPGTVELIEPELEEGAALALQGHGMDPVAVLMFARRIGRLPERTLVVGCEPDSVVDPESQDELAMELSPAVRAAVDPTVRLVESLLRDLMTTSDGGANR
jgi:hydrogenase maturation protease